jgi:hypothetical protein
MALNTNKNGRVRTVNQAAVSTGTEITLYTCPANCKSVASLLYLTNASTGNAVIQVNFNRAVNGTAPIDNAQMKIMNANTLATGVSTELLTGGYFVLEAGDTIKITATGSSTIRVDAMVTVEEFFIPVGG